jgi:hypothetical protein
LSLSLLDESVDRSVAIGLVAGRAARGLPGAAIHLQGVAHVEDAVGRDLGQGDVPEELLVGLRFHRRLLLTARRSGGEGDQRGDEAEQPERDERARP